MFIFFHSHHCILYTLVPYLQNRSIMNDLKFNSTLFFVLIAFTTLYSCQQMDENLEFSCDPVINEFVIAQKEELAQLNRNEIVSYEPALQKAIYNSWDYQKKREAWLNKFNVILTDTTLLQAEKEHIQKLIDHIHIYYFKAEVKDSEQQSRIIFSNDWISYGKNELGWDKKTIIFLVSRLYTNWAEFDAELDELMQIKASISTDTEVECLCSTSTDYCSNSDCLQGSCETTSGGCGWLWNESCDGYCDI